MSTSKWVQGDAEGAFTQLSLETGGNVESESFLREFSCSQSLGALDTLPELLMLVDVQRDAAEKQTRLEDLFRSRLTGLRRLALDPSAESVSAEWKVDSSLGSRFSSGKSM